MIAILLSTYNGEKYLNELLQSLVSQSYSGFKILIRDDGSSDSTLSLLRYYESNYPELIEVFHNDKNENLGVKGSFEYLMKNAFGFDYFAFCDQDDVWHPNKIDLLISEIKKIEDEIIQDFPVLIFSDMEIVDENLKFLNKTFYNNTIGFKQSKIKNGLFQGYISGCLMLFNLKAKEVYFKTEKSKLLHDYNLYMAVHIYGKVSYFPKQLIMHRIHASNFFGISSPSPWKIEVLDLIKFIFDNESYRKIKLADYFSFIEEVADDIDYIIRSNKELYNIMQVTSLSYFKRKKWYIKHFLPFKLGFIRGLIHIILI